MSHIPYYDLYLARRCSSLPNFDGLKEQISIVTYPVFQQWITTQGSAAPGFLQLDLSYTLAEALLQRLQAAGAMGMVVQAAYRRPNITRDEARLLAEKAIEELGRKRFAAYTFAPAVFYSEQPQTWVFTAPSEQLLAEGYIPGALFAEVDKLDGHIWPDEELEWE